MSAARPSPRILSIVWGQTEVENLGVCKDVKLWPGGGRDWNWRETGTNHVPGILPGDVQELIDRGADVIVLSKGMQLRLQTAQETLALLRRQSLEVYQAETMEAVDLYNRLVASRNVGCLIHSTC
jgi:hypothetical protein